MAEVNDFCGVRDEYFIGIICFFVIVIFTDYNIIAYVLCAVHFFMCSVLCLLCTLYCAL
jgi:hypothetical protein